MRLFLLLVASLIMATPDLASAADDQCDIGGEHRFIPLPPGTRSINGVLERTVETPVCWSIRQNEGSQTQMVFFRRLEGGQNPGPTIKLNQFCQGNECKIVGTMKFGIQTFRQEDIVYRIHGYAPGRVEVFSLGSGHLHIDCHSDGETKVTLFNNPRDWHQDSKTSREAFESVTEIVVDLDRPDDSTEAGCDAPKHNIFEDGLATARKTANDLIANLRGDYINQGPERPGLPTGAPKNALRPSYGPYGGLECAGPAGPDMPSRSVTCYSGLGADTWWVCTGRSASTGTGLWIKTDISCNLPGPLPLN